MITMTVRVSVDDHEQTDQITRRLNKEMRELDIEDARLACADHLPTGAKATSSPWARLSPRWPAPKFWSAASAN